MVINLYERDETRKSHCLRRLFSIIIFFNVLVLVLIWLIYFLIADLNCESFFNKEIINFSLQTSTIELIFIALVKSIYLSIIYSCFSFYNIFYVSISSLLTTIFLVIKVIIFEWSNFELVIFPIIITVLSLSGTCCEFTLILIDNYFISHQSTNTQPANIESTPIVHDTRNSQSSSTTTSCFEDAKSFCSWSNSLITNLSFDDISIDQQDFEYKLRQDCLRKSHEIFERTWFLFTDNSNWIYEKRQKADFIHTKTIFDLKIFRLTAIINIPSRILYDILYLNIDATPSWNSSVTEIYIVRRLDDNTDIVYLLSPGIKGLVSSRDFLNVRNSTIKNNCYIISSCSIEHDLIPISENYIRAENKISSFIISPNTESPKTCTLYWYLNTDIKGTIPTYLVNSRVPVVMFDFLDNLRNYIQKS